MAKKSKIFDFKSLDVWDWAFLGALLFVVLFQLFTFSDLKQIPGPIFGGDLYYHYGHVNHIAEGGSVMKSANYLGEYEYYPWLTHLGVVLLAWIFPGINVFQSAVMFFPLLIVIASALVVYLLGNRFLDSKPLAFLLSFFWIIKSVSGFTPSLTTTMLMVPLIFFFVYYSKSLKQRILAGIILGLVGIQHLTLFLGSFIAIGLLFLFRVLSAHVKIKKDKLKIVKKSKFWKTFLDQIIFFLPILILGILISLIYLWAPLFVYQGETPNPWQEYTAGGLKELNLSSFAKQVMKIFFTSNSWFNILLSIVAIIGVYASFKLKKLELPGLIFLVGIIGYLHPIITVPLLGTSFGYYRFPSIFFPLVRYLLIGLGLYFIYGLINKHGKKVYGTAFVVVLVLLGLFSYTGTLDDYKNNRWTQIGFDFPESTKALFDISEYVKKNTDVYDVFLASHGESAFAFHALSGRKVVFMRRTHASPYVNTNERVADAAVMLYGNNTKIARELKDKYKVKYYYEDFYAAQAKQQCLAAWEQLEQIPDSSYSCLRTTTEYKEYLEENNVEFKQIRARLDPADARAPTYDLLAIKPKNVQNFNFTGLFQGTAQGSPVAVVLGVI